MNQEVLNFIHKRFSRDNNWVAGNCYYFAVILKARFPQGIIKYDVLGGHFVVEIDNINSDWQGVVPTTEKQFYVDWDKFDQYDSLQKQRIIDGCIL